MRKWIPLIIYIVLLLFFAGAVYFDGGVFWYMLFFSGFLYLPISFFYLLYVKYALRIHQELEGRKLYKNKAESYTLLLKNEGPLSIGGIRLFMEEGITSFSDDIIGETFELMPHEKREIETNLFLRYAGSYEAGITEITLRDVFGILRMRYHIPAPLRVQVMPAVTTMADSALDQMLDTVTRGLKIVTDAHGEDIRGTEIRTYVPGDPIKQIHWKNYARSGELYVRLPDAPNTKLPIVLLAPEHFTNTLQAIERRDYFIEYAVSIANYFAKRKKPVTFLMGADGRNRLLVEDYESFYKFYEEITREMKSVEIQSEILRDVLLVLKEKDNRLCLNESR